MSAQDPDKVSDNEYETDHTYTNLLMFAIVYNEIDEPAILISFLSKCWRKYGEKWWKYCSNHTGNGPFCEIPLFLHTYTYTWLNTHTQFRMWKMMLFLSRLQQQSLSLTHSHSLNRLLLRSCHILQLPRKKHSLFTFTYPVFLHFVRFLSIHQICHIAVLIIHYVCVSRAYTQREIDNTNTLLTHACIDTYIHTSAQEHQRESMWWNESENVKKRKEREEEVEENQTHTYTHTHAHAAANVNSIED